MRDTSSLSARIPLEGTPNFRDYGGYRIKSGEYIARGRLFRSGHLSELTQADLSLVQSLDIRLVFDFRREAERIQEPSQFPPLNIPEVVHLPIDPGRTLNVNVLEISSHAAIQVDDVIEFMCNVNRELVRDYSAQYRQMFEHLLNTPSGASLIHCSAGKDRTGFAAAMVLSALDVPETIVIQDYLLSAQFFDIDQEIMRFCQRLNWERDHAIVRPVLEVREEYLRAAFATIAEQYDGLNDYLTEELGVDTRAREELRARYVKSC